MLLTITGCNVSRKVAETEKDTDEKTEAVIKTTRTTEEKLPNEKISGDIIPRSERLLDSITGLYEAFKEQQSKGPLTRTVIYKPDGTTQVDCELAEFYRRIVEDIIENKSSQKTEAAQTRNVDKQIDTNINWTLVALIVIAGILLLKKI